MFYLLTLNFLALGTFSPARILSAPTFLPLLGQPYFGPKTLFHNLQEDPNKTIARQAITRRRGDTVFINIGSTGNCTKAKNIIWRLQALGQLLRILASKPVGISHVIFRYPVDFVMYKLLGNVFNFFCRYTRVNGSRLYLGAFKYHRSSGDD